MKLASDRLLYQLLTHSCRGLIMKGNLFGRRFLTRGSTRLGRMGLTMRPLRHPRARRSEPPQRIQKADPLHGHVLEFADCRMTRRTRL